MPSDAEYPTPEPFCDHVETDFEPPKECILPAHSRVTVALPDGVVIQFHSCLLHQAEVERDPNVTENLVFS